MQPLNLWRKSTLIIARFGGKVLWLLVPLIPTAFAWHLSKFGIHTYFTVTVQNCKVFCSLMSGMIWWTVDVASYFFGAAFTLVGCVPQFTYFT